MKTSLTVTALCMLLKRKLLTSAVRFSNEQRTVMCSEISQVSKFIACFLCVNLIHSTLKCYPFAHLQKFLFVTLQNLRIEPEIRNILKIILFAYRAV